jgi:hypothetical protein
MLEFARKLKHIHPMDLYVFSFSFGFGGLLMTTGSDADVTISGDETVNGTGEQVSADGCRLRFLSVWLSRLFLCPLRASVRRLVQPCQLHSDVRRVNTIWQLPAAMSIHTSSNMILEYLYFV